MVVAVVVKVAVELPVLNHLFR